MRDRRRLYNSLAAPNEYNKLELPGAWEPLGSSCTSQFSEDSRAQNFVSHGDKIRRSQDGVGSHYVTFSALFYGS